MEQPMSQSDLFKGLVVFIHPSIPNILNSQLTALLQHHKATLSPPNSNNDILQSITTKSTHQHLVPTLRPAFDLETTTHIVTNSLHLPEYIALGKSDEDQGDIISFSYSQPHQDDHQPTKDRCIHLVTPLWVTQSYDLNKLQPTRAFSPDPYKFFSGIVVSLDSDSNLPQPDVELIQACVQAWGGQFRRGLTKEVTHLICCNETTKDYKIAQKVKSQLGLRIVLPHWFHHSVFFRKIISEVPFEFPSPSILKPHDPSIDPDRQHGLDGVPGTRLGLASTSHTARKPIEEDSELERLSHQTATQIAFSSQNLSSRPIYQGLSDYLQETNASSLESNQQKPTHTSPKSNDESTAHREFKNKSVYLVSSLGLSLPARRTLARRIQELGANVFDSQDFIGKKAEHVQERPDPARLRTSLKAEHQLIKSDIVICEYRVGWEFWLAWELNKSIGTLHWILCILNNFGSVGSIIRPPTERLLDFPSPLEPIEGFDHPNLSPITISNYAGSTRSYLIRLIEKMHIAFSGSLDYQTAMVVTSNKAGTKVEYATKRGIQIVNHTYIEECFQNWSKQSIQTHHLSFPHGVNLCESVGQLTRTIEGIHKWTKRSEIKERRKVEMDQLPSKLMADNTPVADDQPLNNVDPPVSPLPNLNEIHKSSDVQDPDDQGSQSTEIVLLNQPKPSVSVPASVSSKAIVIERKGAQQPAENVDSSIATTKTSLRPQEEEEEHESQPHEIAQSTSVQAPTAKHVTRKPRLISNSVELSASSKSRTVEPISSPEKNGRDPSPLPSLTGLLESEDSSTPVPQKSPLKRSSIHAQLEDSNDHHQSKKTKQKYAPSKKISHVKPKSSSNDTSHDQSQAENLQGEVSKENSQLPKAVKAIERESTVDTRNDETPVKINKKRKPRAMDETPVAESSKRRSSNINSVIMTSGSSNNPRTGSTRKAAQVALQNVKSAVEDMNLHQKESSKKSKHRSGLVISEADDGGYFGRERQPTVRTKDRRSSSDLNKVKPEEEEERMKSVGPKKVLLKSINKDIENQPPKSQDESSLTSMSDDHNLQLKSQKSSDHSKNKKKEKKLKTLCITQSGERIPVKLQNKLIKMGAKFIDSTPTIEDQCTHLLTNKIARTEKFLTCILLGCFIINHEWADQSVKKTQFLDEEEFQLKDMEGEKLHQFKLNESIQRAHLHTRNGGILNSFKFFLTPTVMKLHSNLMERLIVLAGGQVLKKLPKIEEMKKTNDLIDSLQEQEDTGVPTLQPSQHNNHSNDEDEQGLCLIISSKDDVSFLRSRLKSSSIPLVKIWDSGLVLEGLLVQEIRFDKKYEISLT